MKQAYEIRLGTYSGKATVRLFVGDDWKGRNDLGILTIGNNPGVETKVAIDNADLHALAAFFGAAAADDLVKQASLETESA